MLNWGLQIIFSLCRKLKKNLSIIQCDKNGKVDKNFPVDFLLIPLIEKYSTFIKKFFLLFIHNIFIIEFRIFFPHRSCMQKLSSIDDAECKLNECDVSFDKIWSWWQIWNEGMKKLTRESCWAWINLLNFHRHRLQIFEVLYIAIAIETYRENRTTWTVSKFVLLLSSWDGNYLNCLR